MTSILNGKPLTDGETTDTKDAFELKNGAVRMATPAELHQIIDHMKSFKPKRDYREAVRAVEAEIFEKYPAALIGNQALDFRKQDGVTEIEESVQVIPSPQYRLTIDLSFVRCCLWLMDWTAQANLVERRLNDQLLEDETASNITINRAPAYVGCVSNFSNFLV